MPRRRDRTTRHEDRYTVGPSKLCPWVKGESSGQRHDRRMRVAHIGVDGVRQWCKDRRIQFQVTNHGHHWQFRLPNLRRVEWWPSRAKLVVDKNWQHGYHVHDHGQVQTLIMEVWKRGRHQCSACELAWKSEKAAMACCPEESESDGQGSQAPCPLPNPRRGRQ